MTEIVRKEVCECVNCGNEAEMMITCTLQDVDETSAAKKESDDGKQRIKGTGTCSNCGSEADMWIDY